MKTKQRTLREIALDIRRNWKNVNPYANEYLKVMGKLDTIDEEYLYTNGRTVVMYFLSNATGFRGIDAKRIKLELKNLI